MGEVIGKRLVEAGNGIGQAAGVDIGGNRVLIVKMTSGNGRLQYFFLPCVHTRGLPAVKNTLIVQILAQSLPYILMSNVHHVITFGYELIGQEAAETAFEVTDKLLADNRQR